MQPGKVNDRPQRKLLFRIYGEIGIKSKELEILIMNFLAVIVDDCRLMQWFTFHGILKSKLKSFSRRRMLGESNCADTCTFAFA